MISNLKEVASVGTVEQVNELLDEGWKLLKVFEPKEFIMARYEKKNRESND